MVIVDGKGEGDMGKFFFFGILLWFMSLILC